MPADLRFATKRTFAAELERQASEQAGRVFRWHDGDPVTFGETHRLARSAANQLVALGLERGDTVAIFTKNCARSVDLWLGAPQAGVRSLFLNTALRGTFLTHQLREAQAKAILVDAELVSRLAEVSAALPDLTTVIVRESSGDDDLAAVRDALPGRAVFSDSVLAEGDTDRLIGADPLRWDEPAFVMYTSGTTGQSKGVVLTQNYECVAADIFNYLTEPDAADVMFSTLPIFHQSAAMGGLTAGLLAGRPTALDSAFHVNTCWDRVRHFGATQFLAVGPMLKMLWTLPASSADADLPVRMILGAPFSAEFQHGLEQRYRCRVMQGYAMTEVTFVAMQSMAPSAPGSSGKTNPLYEVAVFDEDDSEVPVGTPGEIVVRPRAPHVMFEGYLNRPSDTLDRYRNLWFHTGDLGRTDADGNLYFVDRKKDAMRRRGENVSSFEVESSVLEHPAVQECAAHAVPSPLGEDDIKICVILLPGVSLTAGELMDFCVARMPRFAVPRYIEFVDDIPKTPTLRVQKHLLRQLGVTPNTWDAEAAGYVVAR